jgi:hypothetical protein
MKKSVILLTVVVILVTACASAGPEPVTKTDSLTEEEMSVTSIEESKAIVKPDQDAADVVGLGEETHPATISAQSDSSLSPAEIDSIKFMREEEKLARDVYLYLSDRWNMNIFANISDSEDTHMEALLTLINRFELEDPVQENGLGVFSNQDLQALYDELTAQGSLSLADALLVGGAIEEIDILDLQDSLVQSSNNAVTEVYENLLKGSTNHLQAFVSIYERQTGETYQPQFLSQEEYKALISLSSGSSGGQGRGMNASSTGKGQNRQ